MNQLFHDRRVELDRSAQHVAVGMWLFAVDIFNAQIKARFGTDQCLSGFLHQLGVVHGDIVPMLASTLGMPWLVESANQAASGCACSSDSASCLSMAQGSNSLILLIGWSAMRSITPRK